MVGLKGVGVDISEEVVRNMLLVLTSPKYQSWKSRVPGIEIISLLNANLIKRDWKGNDDDDGFERRLDLVKGRATASYGRPSSSA